MGSVEFTTAAKSSLNIHTENNVKILVTGDWHLDCFKIGKIDPNTDLDVRVLDFFNAIDSMIDYAIDSKIDLFILNGDLFKGRTSSHKIETLVAERFNKIRKHMDFIINLGNHDYTPKQLAYGIHTYSILDRFQKEGNSFTLCTDISHFKYPDTDLVIYPYHDIKRTTHENNTDLLNWIQGELSSFQLTKPCKLFVGHGTPQGTIFNENWLGDLDSIDEPVLPFTFFEPYDMVLFSHIHRRQKIREKILHIGSPERVDFSEAKDDKGFVVYDTVKKNCKWVSTNPRPMIDIKLDLLLKEGFYDPTEEILNSFKTLSALDKTMIKITVDCSENDMALIDKNLIKQALDRSFYYKPIRYKVPKTQNSRIHDLTEHLGSVEALEKILEIKSDLSEEQKKQILIRGKGILSIGEV